MGWDGRVRKINEFFGGCRFRRTISAPEPDKALLAKRMLLLLFLSIHSASRIEGWLIAIDSTSTTTNALMQRERISLLASRFVIFRYQITVFLYLR